MRYQTKGCKNGWIGCRRACQSKPDVVCRRNFEKLRRPWTSAGPLSCGLTPPWHAVQQPSYIVCIAYSLSGNWCYGDRFDVQWRMWHTEIHFAVCLCQLHTAGVLPVLNGLAHCIMPMPQGAYISYNPCSQYIRVWVWHILCLSDSLSA